MRLIRDETEPARVIREAIYQRFAPAELKPEWALGSAAAIPEQTGARLTTRGPISTSPVAQGGILSQPRPAPLVRVCPRVPVSLTLNLTPLVDDGPQPCPNAENHSPSGKLKVLATDLSSEQITVISETPLTEDGLYAVDLRPVVGQTMVVSASVVYCRRVLGQTYRSSLQVIDGLESI